MAMVIVDSHALACPSAEQFYDADDFADEFTKYLRYLVDWHHQRDIASLRFVGSKETAAILAALNCYPLYEPIAKAIQELGLNDIHQPRDVVTILNGFLARTEHIEDLAEIDEVLVDDGQFSSPQVLARVETFRNHLLRICAAVFVGKQNGLIDIRGAFFAARETIPPVDECEISGSISLLAKVNGDVSDDASQFAVRLPFYFSSEEFCKKFDVIFWWSEGTDVACSDALTVSLIAETGSADALGIVDWKAWSYGAQFVTSARDLGFISDARKAERVLRACRDTVLSRSLEKTHYLRTGQGANDPPHRRGKMTSHRRDIDDEFHLHYWTDGTQVEFANVVVHNDFSISR